MDTIDSQYNGDRPRGQRQVGLVAIGIDERVFLRDSELHQKSLAYGSDFAAAHIIARTLQNNPASYEEGGVMFHPVRVRFSFLFPWAAYRIGRRVMREQMDMWVVSADNPFEIGLVSLLLARLPARRAQAGAPRSFLHLHIHTDFMSPFFPREFLERAGALAYRKIGGAPRRLSARGVGAD